MFDMAKLGKLNSMTKYPSIPTYHKMDRGRLLEEREVIFDDGEKVYVSEKIDGTNGRAILLRDGLDYFIGTREEIVYARGDRVINPEMGIAPNLVPILEKLLEPNAPAHGSAVLVVLYGEVYGRDIGPGKNYGGQYGFRLFDIASFDRSTYNDLMMRSRDRISMWRQHGGTPFVNAELFRSVAEAVGLLTVPHIMEVNGGMLPTSLGDTYSWLKGILPDSRAKTDDLGSGKPEGVILRNQSRTKIAKVRFEDYEKTFRSRK